MRAFILDEPKCIAAAGGRKDIAICLHGPGHNTPSVCFARHRRFMTAVRQRCTYYEKKQAHPPLG